MHVDDDAARGYRVGKIAQACKGNRAIGWKLLRLDNVPDVDAAASDRTLAMASIE